MHGATTPPSIASAYCQNCGAAAQKPTGSRALRRPCQYFCSLLVLGAVPAEGHASYDSRRLRCWLASRAGLHLPTQLQTMEAHMFRRFGFVLFAALVAAVPA